MTLNAIVSQIQTDYACSSNIFIVPIIYVNQRMVEINRRKMLFLFLGIIIQNRHF